MSYEEDKNVSEVRTADAKKQEKALAKLDEQNHDIRKMNTLEVLWHLVVRHRKVWYLTIFGLVCFIGGWFL